MILRLLRGVLMSIGALYLIVTFTPLDKWWIGGLSGPMCNPHGDILILLSAEALSDAIGYDSYWRAVYGVRAWRGDGFHEVFICGGPGANGMPASIPMREFMAAEGVPASAIQIDAASHSTRENALNATAALRNAVGKRSCSQAISIPSAPLAPSAKRACRSSPAPSPIFINRRLSD